MAFPTSYRGVSTFARNFLVFSSRSQRAFKSSQTAIVLSSSSPGTGRRRRYQLAVNFPSLVLLSKLIFDRSRSRLNAFSLSNWLRTLRDAGSSSKPSSKLSFSSSGSQQQDQPWRRDGDNSSGDGGSPWKSGNDGNNGNRRPLKLMDYNELMWPHPWKSLRNFIFSSLISGYYDQAFSISNFLKGAEQAVTVVSGLISKGQFENLDGLVASEAVWELRRNYDLLSDKQRQFVAVNPWDLFFRFVYEIGMIFDDDTDQRFVEITTIFQGFQGMEEAKRRNPNSFTEEMYNNRELIYICNYRFIREFTKGKQDEWIINKLNHFCPVESAETEKEDK